MTALIIAVIVLSIAAGVAFGLLVLLFSLCQAAAGRLTIDQGEAFGGDDDATGR